MRDYGPTKHKAQNILRLGPSDEKVLHISTIFDGNYRRTVFDRIIHWYQLYNHLDLV